jgi:transcriptional regulator with XRE-family HTH domain
MEDVRLGAALRAARVQRRLRQVDVAKAAGVSTSTVSRIEHGSLGGLQLRSVRAVAGALEITIELLPRSRAASLERVVNQAHASLADQVIAWLVGLGGWTVRPEVSFSRFGERGVIDILGWHSPTQALLVIELKTEIVDVGELLGTFDRKARNAAMVGSGVGWPASTTGGLLVIRANDVNRRRIHAHAATFDAAFPARGAEVRRWLRKPRGALRGLLFFANRLPRQANVRVTTVRRVRRTARDRQQPRSSVGAAPISAPDPGVRC